MSETNMFFTKSDGEQNEAKRYLRRICDTTSPNMPQPGDERCDSRQNRTIPVLVTCWEKKGPVPSECITALTRDISDRGLSLTLPAPVRFDDIVIGFWLPKTHGPEPWFFLGRVQQSTPIGGGFWGVGIEVKRVLSQAECRPVVKIARKRLPAQPAASQPPSALLSN